MADQEARPQAIGGYNRGAGGPGLGDGIGAVVLTGGMNKHVAGGEERGELVLPAEKTHTRFDALLMGLAFEIGTIGAVAGNPQVVARQPRDGVEQHLETALTGE